jgi:cold shock CspA family protein
VPENRFGGVLRGSAWCPFWVWVIGTDVTPADSCWRHTQRDEETTPEVFEVSGSVKWFDPSKGYGLIVPDEELPDVLLHVTCLRNGGFQTAYEGARVVCEVVKSSKDLHCVRICGMDDSAAIRPSQLPSAPMWSSSPRATGKK